MGLQRARHHHQPGGVPVQPVNNTRSGQTVKPLIMVQQAVKQGAISVARCRVHHKACGLVDDQQVLVLVDDIQLDGLRLVLQLRLDHHLQTEGFIAGELVLGLGLVAVDGEYAVLDPCLQARAGEAIKQFGSGLIHPLTRLFCPHLLGTLNFLAAKMSHDPTCV